MYTCSQQLIHILTLPVCCCCTVLSLCRQLGPAVTISNKFSEIFRKILCFTVNLSRQCRDTENEAFALQLYLPLTVSNTGVGGSVLWGMRNEDAIVKGHISLVPYN